MFQKFLAALDSVYDDTMLDTTEGSMYYGVLSNVTSGWFMQNIVGQPTLHPRTISLGKTTFFK